MFKNFGRKPVTTKASSIPTLRDLYAIPKYAQNAVACRRDFAEDNPDLVLFQPDDDLNDKIAIWEGDITTLEIDAIVNAANGSLLGGGGVDGAIHRAAGKGLLQECRLLHGCDTGDAKITHGHDLPAKTVIHAVGPIGFKPDLLRKCYWRCLELCDKHELRDVAFCCISTGIFGFPNREAANIALTTARSYLMYEESQIEKIIFCIFLQTDKKFYDYLCPFYFPPAPESHKRKSRGERELDLTGRKRAPEEAMESAESGSTSEKSKDRDHEQKQMALDTKATATDDNGNGTRSPSPESPGVYTNVPSTTPTISMFAAENAPALPRSITMVDTEASPERSCDANDYKQSKSGSDADSWNTAMEVYPQDKFENSAVPDSKDRNSISEASEMNVDTTWASTGLEPCQSSWEEINASANEASERSVAAAEASGYEAQFHSEKRTPEPELIDFSPEDDESKDTLSTSPENSELKNTSSRTDKSRSKTPLEGDAAEQPR
ncbi:hypothetical protein PhCBS80983_g02604 [Powellomyces hirtus]|uniref:Macro domain-containing protein n=1 Tax=Powellomyces hirtus TaxID=109895 RepID=A0A507E5A6_9FUNG|nr:hypothetical protein PhCBS80983_g02604 [Powellomyces hirtus]